MLPETWTPYEYDVQIDGEREDSTNIDVLLEDYPNLSQQKKDLMQEIVKGREIFPGNIHDIDILANTIGKYLYNEPEEVNRILSNVEEWMVAVVDLGGYPLPVAAGLIERIFNKESQYVEYNFEDGGLTEIFRLVNQQLEAGPPGEIYSSLRESDNIGEWYAGLKSLTEPELNLLLLSQGLDTYCKGISSHEKVLHILNNGMLFGALGRRDLWKKQQSNPAGVIKPLPGQGGSCFTVDPRTI